MAGLYTLINRIFMLTVTAVALVSASLGITYADSFEEGSFPRIEVGEQAEDSVRVMSFNLRCTDVNGVPAIRRYRLGAAQIIEAHPDSVGVQEATPMWMLYLRLHLPEYSGVGLGRDGGHKGEHCAIFYNKTKYDAIDHGMFWLSETPDEPSFGLDAACRRVCTWVILKDKATGKEYAHVNSHFDNAGQNARVMEAEMISSFIRERFAGIPVVFTADLNSRASEKAYKIMTEELEDTALIAESAETFGTFHDGRPQEYAKTIDYVMCSPGATVADHRTVTAGINGRLVSDHFPIYSDIIFESEG